MTERRRSLFVLLLVLGPARGLARGRSPARRRSSASTSRAASSSSTRASRPRSSRRSRRRRCSARWTSCATASTRSASSEPELRCSGGNQIEVEPPRRRQRRARGPAGRLDRAAVLLRLGSEHPRRDVQGEPGRELDAQKTPITGFYNGGQEASKCARASRTTTTTPPTRRGSTRSTRSPSNRSNNGQPSDSKEAALARPRLRSRRKQRRGRRGRRRGSSSSATRSRDAERPGPRPLVGHQDNPALSGTDIKNPKQNSDQQAGNEPIVTFDFTDKGRKASTRSRAQIAQRGVDNSLPGDNPRPRVAALRDRARQPARSRRRTSTTTRTRTASTARPARRSPALHDRLGAGPGEDPRDRRAADPARPDLALAGLGHARPAGARPGPHRGHRGLRGRRPVPARSSTACSA